MSTSTPAEPTAAARAARLANRKMAVVLELLRGEDLDHVSRKCDVSAATVFASRDASLASGAGGLKSRQDDLVDENGRRMKSVIAELAMANELLQECVQQLENASRSLKRTSKR